MGGFDPNPYDDVSNYLNFPNDSDDDDGAPTQNHPQNQDVKGMSTPISPPASSADDDAIEDDQDDDLYGTNEDTYWKNTRRESCASASLDSPVNPQWLLSDQPPRHSNLSLSEQHHPSPPGSDDAKSPSDRRTALQTIQEKNELLIKTQTNAKTSKSFPLLPDLLSLKQAEDEDEKILASEEGKRLNPRERRQLRNKVSARNFRVRRKEYIGHLENLVESQNQEIETLRQSLNTVQLENTQLRQESGFLRSIALNQQPQASSQPQNDPVLPVPNKDPNPNSFDWPLAYDGSNSPTQPNPNNNKFADRGMFGGGHIHAYGVRVPEVQFDKPHLQNSAPPLPPPPTPQQYSPASPRSSQEAPKTPPGMPQLPPGVDNLGYPGMLQAVSYLYDYIVKASSGNPIIPQPQQQPMSAYPMQQVPYHPQPQQWGDAKHMGAPALGFNPYANGNWGWGGGPPGPAA